MVGGYITQTYRVFYVTSRRQSIGFHRESHKEATLSKFLFYLKCLGLNDNPRTKFVQQFYLLFALFMPQTLEFALLRRQNKFYLLSLQNLKLTNASHLNLNILRSFAGLRKIQCSEERRSRLRLPIYLSARLQSLLHSVMQRQPSRAFYKICGLTIKNSLCHHSSMHYIYFPNKRVIFKEKLSRDKIVTVEGEICY